MATEPDGYRDAYEETDQSLTRIAGLSGALL